MIKTQPFNFEIERLEIEPTMAKAEWTTDLSHDIMQYYLFYNVKGAETSRMKMTEETAITLEGLIPDTEYDLIIEGTDLVMHLSKKIQHKSMLVTRLK